RRSCRSVAVQSLKTAAGMVMAPGARGQLGKVLLLSGHQGSAHKPEAPARGSPGRILSLALRACGSISRRVLSRSEDRFRDPGLDLVPRPEGMRNVPIVV